MIVTLTVPTASARMDWAGVTVTEVGMGVAGGSIVTTTLPVDIAFALSTVVQLIVTLVGVVTVGAKKVVWAVL